MILNLIRDKFSRFKWIGETPPHLLVQNTFKNLVKEKIVGFSEIAQLNFPALITYLRTEKNEWGDLFQLNSKGKVIFRGKDQVLPLSEFERSLFDNDILKENLLISMNEKNGTETLLQRRGDLGRVQLAKSDIEKMDTLAHCLSSISVTHTHTTLDLLLFYSNGVRLVAHGLSEADREFALMLNEKYHVPVSVKALSLSGLSYEYKIA